MFPDKDGGWQKLVSCSTGLRLGIAHCEVLDKTLVSDYQGFMVHCTISDPFRYSMFERIENRRDIAVSTPGLKMQIRLLRELGLLKEL